MEQDKCGVFKRICFKKEILKRLLKKRRRKLCLLNFPFPYAGMTRIRFEETLSAARQVKKKNSFKRNFLKGATPLTEFAVAKIRGMSFKNKKNRSCGAAAVFKTPDKFYS